MKWNDQGNLHQKTGMLSLLLLKKISGAWLNILRSNTSTEESRNATQMYNLS